MKNYCLAIGYPIGLNRLSDGSMAYCIELQDRIVPLPLPLFHSWSRILRRDIDASLPIEHIKALSGLGLTLWCNTRESAELRLQGYTGIRQGYSSIDENGNFAVYLGKDKQILSTMQLRLWMCADGILPFSEFMTKTGELTEENCFNAVMTLMQCGLLFLR